MPTRRDIKEPLVVPEALLSVDVVDTGDGTVVLTVVGEIDQDTRDIFAGAIDDALTTRHCCRLEIELSAVPFMDSAGVNALVQRRMAADERGLDLVVVRPHTHVQRVLEICGLAEVLCA